MIQCSCLHNLTSYERKATRKPIIYIKKLTTSLRDKNVKILQKPENQDQRTDTLKTWDHSWKFQTRS